MSNVMERGLSILQVTLPCARGSLLAHPFGVDQHETHKWRVSPDVWAEILDECEPGLSYPRLPEAIDRLFGEPISIDNTLPPNSMLLEPDR